jgi:hypothetical protein
MKDPKVARVETLESAARFALWFIASESKRVALAKALASGNRDEIKKAAKGVIGSIQYGKAKLALMKFL